MPSLKLSRDYIEKTERTTMPFKKKMVIVEDHQILRDGLKTMIAAFEDVEIVGEAQDGLDAIREIRKCKPDIVLLDLSLPKRDGFSVMKEVKSQFPEIKILALTIHENDQYVLDAFEAGADGYCIKDANRQELEVAIKSVLRQKRYVSPGITDKILEGFIEGRKKIKEKSTWDTVTQREREILKLIAEGYLNKEIADILNISIKTVEKHRANIMKKLDLHNVAALTSFAIKRGLTDGQS
jgi:DNA-binding NarL/FixJ family response regulator